MTRTNLPSALLTTAVLALTSVPAAFAQPVESTPATQEEGETVTAAEATPLPPRELRSIIREGTELAARQTAFDDLVKAADGGDALAALFLGDLYRSGIFVDTDLAKAADAYRMAIDGNNATAARTLGDMYLRGDAPDVTPEQALSYYELAAERGDGRAQQRLGDFYRDGNMVTADTARAEEYYGQAIDTGLASASLRLGDLYRRGENPADSLPVYQAAADRGDTDAMIRLGDIYRDGTVGDADLAQAATYYKQALDAGADSAFNRLVAAYLGNPASVSDGVALLEEASAAGRPGAAVRLANAYLNGEGVEADIPRAIAVLEAAIAAEDPLAVRRLVRLYIDGKGRALARQPREAEQILERYAALLNEDALFRDRLAVDAATARNEDAFGSILDRYVTLDGESQATLAGQMGMANQNAYVLMLQSHLSEQGLYSGTLSGLLTQSTINAFNEFCARQQAAATCSGGPLSSPARRLFRDALEQGG